MRRFFLCTLFLVTVVSAGPAVKQDSTQLPAPRLASGEDLRAALVDYVYDLFIENGEQRIPREKYLVNLIYLVNDEISRRLKSPASARKQYFDDLHDILTEIQQLRNRLKSAGIRELDTFVDDLDMRIRTTIDQREVDFRKKKVFEDALQMLYVSEEMIKLDQLQDPSELTTRIDRSKTRLLNAFGEVDVEEQGGFGREITVYDVFVEWKKTDRVKYSLRLADVRLTRRNLLKASSPNDIMRMFNDQLKLACIKYNLSEYDVAELLFADLLETYPDYGVRNLDDVYFYRAECNFALTHLMHAKESYLALLSAYPSTTYLPQAYSRLVQVHYSLDEYARAIEYGTLYQNLAPAGNPGYYDIQFLMAMSHYELGNYDQTVESLMNVPQDHPYYHLAQYFMANAYADSDLYDEAVRIYLKMIADRETPPYLYARSLYKMGIIEYERGYYENAIAYLNNINDGFSRYDKVLNALAWSHFEKERSKPSTERRDFSQANLYARRLISEYHASPYQMEATGLLAYINQFEDEPVEAIGLYREVYQAKVKRGSIESYLTERKRLEQLLNDAQNVREKSLQENNAAAFARADRLVGELDAQLKTLDISETSSTGLSVYQEARTIIDQIKELNQLRLAAEEAGNPGAVERIDSLQMRLTAVLESFPSEVFDPSKGVNLFDDYPVSKYVAEETFRYDDMMRKRVEINEEVRRVEEMMQTLESRIDRARLHQDFDLVARLEQQYQNLEDLRKEFDVLMVATHQVDANPNPYPEFNRWGDLGAFGIINVYFDQKQRNQSRLVKVAEVFDRVNKQLDQRKEIIEDKIRKIEAEIRFMTMKARMEERARLRAERERAFRESYFDTRESEIPEEN